MTTAADLRYPAKVTSLLARRGATLTVRIPTGDPSYSVDGSVTDPSTEVSIKATPPVGSDFKLISGPRLEVGELVIYIDASRVPNARWVVVVGGRDRTVKRIDPIYSGDLVAAYQVVLDAI